MDRVAIAGLSLHDTNVAGLERLREALKDAPDLFARELADELAASEVVMLATCNRLEVAFAREQGHLPSVADIEIFARAFGLDDDDPLRGRLWLKQGRNAVHHVLRVACSLDSLVLGEDQILGQLREAFAASRALGLSGPLLNPVFEAAVQVGKEVRTQTQLSRRPVSVVSLGVSLIGERFADGPPPRLALIGAGKMGALVGHAAQDAGLPIALVANRTAARAAELAGSIGAAAVDLAALLGGAEAVDGVVCATSAPGTVLDESTLIRLGRSTPSGRPLVALDLAVPRDVAPTEHASVEVIGIDDLSARAEENRAARWKEAARAEEIVERKLRSLHRRVSDQRVARSIQECVSETSDVLEHELRSLRGGRLSQLDDGSLRAVESWARTTFGRVNHVPIRALKRLAADLSSGRVPEGGRG